MKIHPKKSSARLKKGALALKIGVSRPTLNRYLAMEGAPTADKRGCYVPQAVAMFIAANSPRGTGDPEVQRLRTLKLSLQVEAMETDGMLRRGELVELARVHPTIAAFNAELTANLQRKFEIELPAKYRGRSPAECRLMNEQAIAFVLERLRAGQAPLVGSAQPPAEITSAPTGQD